VGNQPFCLIRSSARELCAQRPVKSVPIARRYLQSAAVADSTIPLPNALTTTATRTPDASFQVLGAPFSLLSVSLSPSQTLYTRRGTLVGLTGSVENVISTLSILSPLRRATFGIPFLYQKLTSISPLTAIIGTNSTSTSLSTVNLDGRLDWVIAQRNALLAWTGEALIVKPKVNFQASFAHWGNTFATGRGLIALVGRGQIYQINLGKDDEYVVHPKHVVAYTASGSAPSPFRFRSNALRFQVPSFSSFLPDTKFFREIKNTPTWKWLANVLYTIRTWARRSIWGDRLFLTFKGPATILVQSRASSIVESLTTEDINDIADTPAGIVQSTISSNDKQAAKEAAKERLPLPPTSSRTESAPKMRYAVVGPSGQVKIQ